MLYRLYPLAQFERIGEIMVCEMLSTAVAHFPNIHTCSKMEFVPLEKEIQCAIAAVNKRRRHHGSSSTVLLENALVFSDTVVFVFATMEREPIEDFMRQIDFDRDEYSLHQVMDSAEFFQSYGRIYYRHTFAQHEDDAAIVDGN